MQTQGVSLVSAGLKSSGTSHATKVNDTTFDSFMSNHAQKRSQLIHYCPTLLLME